MCSKDRMYDWAMGEGGDELFVTYQGGYYLHLGFWQIRLSSKQLPFYFSGEVHLPGKSSRLSRNAGCSPTKVR